MAGVSHNFRQIGLRGAKSSRFQTARLPDCGGLSPLSIGERVLRQAWRWGRLWAQRHGIRLAVTPKTTIDITLLLMRPHRRK
jgi:hypothetical protein